MDGKLYGGQTIRRAWWQEHDTELDGIHPVRGAQQEGNAPCDGNREGKSDLSRGRSSIRSASPARARAVSAGALRSSTLPGIRPRPARRAVGRCARFLYRRCPSQFPERYSNSLACRTNRGWHTANKPHQQREYQPRTQQGRGYAECKRQV